MPWLTVSRSTLPGSDIEGPASRGLQFARWRSALEAVGADTFASGLAAIVGLASNVLISRQLGSSARGEVAFVLQLAYLVSSVLLFGVDRQALRGESKQETGSLTRHLVPLTVVLTMVLFAVFRDWRALASMLALPLAWLSIRWSESLRDHSFTRYLRPFVAYQLSVAACVGLLFLTGNDDWRWWLLPYALPSLVVFLNEIVKNRRIGMRGLFGHLNRTSLLLLPSTIATLVVLRADRLLMPSLASNSQLGLYAAVATATELIYWIAQALADHRVSRLSPGRSVMGLLRSLVIDAIMFAFVAAITGVLISSILIPLLGPEFVSARQLILPLSLAAVVLAIYRQAVGWHLGGAKPGTVTIIEVATAVFALPCYWFAIRAGGALGAAWGSMTVYGFGVILALIMAAAEKPRASSAADPPAATATRSIDHGATK